MATVYRHFDEDNQLLYIGSTINWVSRMQEHRSQANWYEAVAKITLRHYPDIKTAREAEWIAISREKPLYNKLITHDGVHFKGRGAPSKETRAVRLEAIDPDAELEGL